MAKRSKVEKTAAIGVSVLTTNGFSVPGKPLAVGLAIVYPDKSHSHETFPLPRPQFPRTKYGSIFHSTPSTTGYEGEIDYDSDTQWVSDWDGTFLNVHGLELVSYGDFSPKWSFSTSTKEGCEEVNMKIMNLDWNPTETEESVVWENIRKWIDRHTREADSQGHNVRLVVDNPCVPVILNPHLSRNLETSIGGDESPVVVVPHGPSLVRADADSKMVEYRALHSAGVLVSHLMDEQPQ